MKSEVLSLRSQFLITHNARQACVAKIAACLFDTEVVTRVRAQNKSLKQGKWFCVFL